MSLISTPPHTDSHDVALARRPRLVGEVLPVRSITDCEREQMLVLMQSYYHNVSFDRFTADLSEKDWVILARDQATGLIRGFSTQMLIELPDKRAAKRAALFSGDTIIDRAYWGQNPLAQLWGRVALTLIDEDPERELFWFLISKGYKTYRFLPVFFNEFFPRIDVATPAWAEATMSELGQARFPYRFDAEHGLVRAGSGDERLRADVAEVDDRRRRNRDIEFFETRNPNHALGDELCCLARLSRENFKRGAFKVIGSPETLKLPKVLGP